METRLRAIVARVAETTADFPADAVLGDTLDVDSIRGLEIMFEIEQAYGIKIPLDRYGEVRTFADLMRLTESIVSTQPR